MSSTAVMSAVNVRVTEPARAPELVSYFDELGLHAVAGPDGAVRILPWEHMEWLAARLEIERSIHTWVKTHGVPVQVY
jgi:hypothetical protein